MSTNTTREVFFVDDIVGRTRVRAPGARLALVALTILLLFALAAIPHGRGADDDAPDTDAADIMQGP